MPKRSRSRSGEPFVRGSDLLPLLRRNLPDDDLRYAHNRFSGNNGTHDAVMSNYRSLTNEVTTHIDGITLNAVQKVVRGLLDGRRHTVKLSLADAICLACGSTLSAEGIQLFFHTKKSAYEAILTYEDLYGKELFPEARDHLVDELLRIANSVSRGKRPAASEPALVIMGGRA